MTDPSPPSPAIRNVSDTALWAAIHRARESERPDALFHDPYARRLAGERGERISREFGRSDSREWPWAMRTIVFDQYIAQCVRNGADMIVNLAAGFDARPQRMDLPANLRWIEVDMPELLEEKARVMGGVRARCRLEHEAMDLADASARQALFAELGAQCRKAMIVCEGLLIYLGADEVAALGRDLAVQPSFAHWAFDMCSPGLLKMLRKQMGGQLDAAKAPFRFAPPEGPGFFQPLGWEPLEVRSILKTAAKYRRVPWVLRMLSMLPASNGRQGNRPWGGLCLMQRRDDSLSR